eukprot:1097856-Rhodomonas_salina.2
MQSVIASEPAGESEFAGHCTHADPPVSFRYVPEPQAEQDSDPCTPVYDPAAHAEHADAFGPTNPGLQVQFRKDTAMLASERTMTPARMLMCAVQVAGSMRTCLANVGVGKKLSTCVVLSVLPGNVAPPSTATQFTPSKLVLTL